MSVARKMIRPLLWPFRCSFGKKCVETALVALSRLSAIELWEFADRRVGINNFVNDEVSGEAHVIRSVLPRIAPRDAVLFDVGANVGKYSEKLRKTFPHARIFAFEPNPQTFAQLSRSAKENRIEPTMAAVGESVGKVELFILPNEWSDELATLHRDVLTDIHGGRNVEATMVDVVTLDDFCGSRGIDRIDFLKIDTEGHELSVLKGASRLLAANGMKTIQFEFNEMNIVSRSFLRDFYQLLPCHRFYRLGGNRLIPLGAYRAHNEIFRFQNILAVHDSIDPSCCV